ncbi:MAG: oligosaccharide flippase family protein [Bacteroidaceae bacterium]|nr:oligosaccharide flippase family protein [Bacteroidaceae bacterium]
MQKITKYSLSIKNIGYYFSASFIPMLITLALNPLYTTFLSPSDYAIIGYYNSFNTLFSPLILFYFNQYYIREYFYRDEVGRLKLRALVFKTFLFLPFILGAFSLLGIFLYKNCFVSESEIPFSPYAILALLPSVMVGMYRLELIDLKVKKNGKRYFQLALLNAVIIAISSISFVVLAEWGASGQFLGAMSGPLFFYLYALRKKKELFSIAYEYSEFKKAITFCWPLVLAGMFDFFASGYDKVVLEKMVSIESLGYYSVGISIGSYLGIFSGAIADTFSPDIYDALAKKEYRRMLKYAFLQIGVMLCVVLIFVLFAKYVVMILTANRYTASTLYAQIASFGALTSCIYCIVSNVVQSFKKTKIVLSTKVFGSILCICSYNMLIEKFDIAGAAAGYALSYVYFSIIALVLLFISLQIDKKRKL